MLSGKDIIIILINYEHKQTRIRQNTMTVRFIKILDKIGIVLIYPSAILAYLLIKGGFFIINKYNRF